MISTRTIRLKNQIIALWKRCLSFRKHDWELSDYPVAIREQEFNVDYTAPRFAQHRYIAYIVNWVVSGSGDTPKEAMADLANKFQTVKNKWRIEGSPLLRPGAVGPVEF